MSRFLLCSRLLAAGAVLALLAAAPPGARAQLTEGGYAYYDYINLRSDLSIGGTWKVTIGTVNKSFGGAGVFNGNTNKGKLSGTTISPIGPILSKVSVCADLFGTAHDTGAISHSIPGLTSSTPFPGTPDPGHSNDFPLGAVTNKKALNFLVSVIMTDRVTSTAAFDTRLSVLGTLTNFGADAKERGAAFQAAVWNYWYDTDTTVIGGNFKITQAGSSGSTATRNANANKLIAAVNSYLTTHSSSSPHYTGWYLRDVKVGKSGLSNGAYQSMLVAVPEPAFLQLSALLALGGFGLRRRARKK